MNDCDVLLALLVALSGVLITVIYRAAGRNDEE